jgi:hypothetical protein
MNSALLERVCVGVDRVAGGPTGEAADRAAMPSRESKSRFAMWCLAFFWSGAKGSSGFKASPLEWGGALNRKGEELWLNAR